MSHNLPGGSCGFLTSFRITVAKGSLTSRQPLWLLWDRAIDLLYISTSRGKSSPWTNIGFAVAPSRVGKWRPYLHRASLSQRKRGNDGHPRFSPSCTTSAAARHVLVSIPSYLRSCGAPCATFGLEVWDTYRSTVGSSGDRSTICLPKLRIIYFFSAGASPRSMHLYQGNGNTATA